MSRVNAVADDVKSSFRSLLSLDTDESDMRKLAEDKVVKGKGGKVNVYANISGDSQKANTIIAEIGQIIQKDIESDGPRSAPTSPKNAVKSSKVITTKDYIKGINKEKKNPSVSDLLNNPLRDSYSGLEYGPGDDAKISKESVRASREMKLTAKDLNRSIDKNLDFKSNSPSLKSKKYKDNFKGSASKLINSPLNPNGEEDSPKKKEKDASPLGVTAKDLRSIDKNLNLLEGQSPKEKKKTNKSDASALAQISAPLKKSTGDLATADLGKIPLPPKPKNEDNAMYTATEAQKKKHAHEKVNFE